MSYPRTLADFEGDWRPSGDQLNFMVCPVCGSRGWNIYVDPKTGKWMCFARNHGKGGRVSVTDLSDDRRLEMLQDLRNEDGVPEEWPEVNLPAHRPLSDMALAYLYRRRITPELCTALGMVEMAHDSRILIPYFGPGGRIIHWVGRQYIDCRVTKQAPKYMAAPGAKPPYMLPRWEQVDEVVLVEGPMDAIAVMHATGRTVMSIGGTTMSKRIEHDIRSLVRHGVDLMLDGDADVKSYRLAAQLEDKFTVRVHILSDEHDPASLHPVELRRMLS